MKFTEFTDLNKQKDKLIKQMDDTNKLVSDIKSASFPALQFKNKIFSDNTDIKKLVEQISRKLLIKNILLKENTSVHENEKILETKFTVLKEKQIYEFIDALYRELAGIVKFESIKIIKSNEKQLSVKILCKIFMIDKDIAINSIEITRGGNRHNNVKSLNFFVLEKATLHTLFCIINNSKAYIDDSWFRIGDKIEDYKITGIYSNFIEIQNDNQKSIIKLGSSW
jgi:hypothetical protein